MPNPYPQDSTQGTSQSQGSAGFVFHAPPQTLLEHSNNSFYDANTFYYELDPSLAPVTDRTFDPSQNAFGGVSVHATSNNLPSLTQGAPIATGSGYTSTFEHHGHQTLQASGTVPLSDDWAVLRPQSGGPKAVLIHDPRNRSDFFAQSFVDAGRALGVDGSTISSRFANEDPLTRQQWREYRPTGSRTTFLMRLLQEDEFHFVPRWNTQLHWKYKPEPGQSPEELFAEWKAGIEE